MKVGSRNIIVSGRAIRTAQIDGDGFRFIEDPEAILADLRSCGQRIDLFTFIQRLSHGSPRYCYPMEWDNLAAIDVKSFDYWWNEQIGKKTRNKARLAEKKGVILCEMPFDEALARGIWEIYNETP